MLNRSKNLAIIFLMIISLCGACYAQQPKDIRQLVPSDSLLAVGIDLSPTNPSIQAITKATDACTLQQMDSQKQALIKAAESFATLFGVSFDFAKDIQSWAGPEWAFVLVPDEKAGMQPVFLTTITNQSAAEAAIEKFLNPLGGIAELEPQPDNDFSITAVKIKDKNIELYVSASTCVVAFSPSKTALKHVLSVTGLEPESAATRTLFAFSDSVLFAYVDPSRMKEFNGQGLPIPVDGFGLGVSVVDTGAKLQIIGRVNKNAAAVVKQFMTALPTGSLCVNRGVPATSVAAMSLPDITGLLNMASVFAPANEELDFLQVFRDTQTSSAVTAVLPLPSGVLSLETQSEQAAADKLQNIVASLKKLKMVTEPSRTVAGIEVVPVKIPKYRSVYLAHVGKNVFLATDSRALTSAVASAAGKQPSLADSCVYKETMAGLGDSNILTAYLSLSSIQGLGYLMQGLGLNQLAPVYGSLARGLEDVQAAGLGVGYSSDTVTVTLFLRANPRIMPATGVTAALGTAIGVAVAVPPFVRARQAAQTAQCIGGMDSLAKLAISYASETGKLPTAAKWRSQITGYPGVKLACPRGKAIYAFNKNLSGLSYDKIGNPSEVVLFFEASPSLANAVGSRSDAIFPHNGQGVFAFLDGHVESLSEAPAASQWVPKLTTPKVAKKAPAGKNLKKKK